MSQVVASWSFFALIAVVILAFRVGHVVSAWFAARKAKPLSVVKSSDLKIGA